MQCRMVRMILFLFALLSFCSCQQPIVLSSGQTDVNFPYNTRATQYSSHNSKPNNWKRYGSIPNKGKYYGNTQTRSKYYGSTQTQSKYFGSTQTQSKYFGSTQTQSKYYGSPQDQSKNYGNTQTRSKYKRGKSMKLWGFSYSRPTQSQKLKNDKGIIKPKVLYKSETLKTKPYAYRLKSVGRTLIDQYLQNLMFWGTCTTIVTNIINTVFNPTSDFVNIFINAGVENWCGNKLYDIFQPFISPYTDRIFENLNLERD